MSKSRNYVFTLNNYQAKPDMKGHLDSLVCRYMKYGKEVGEEGTPHLQGLVVFNSPTSLSSAIKKLPGCHVEVMKSLVGSLEYVGKDGDVTERGERPMLPKEKGEKGKEFYDNVLELARSDRIDEIDSETQLRFGLALRRERDEAGQKRKFEDTEEKMLWYCGPTGSGKSRKARTDHPDAYLKMCNKWWDHYQDQETVLIEDLDVKHDIMGHHLKIWADRYPFLAEYKGGAKKIRPTRIIVTSNYHPRDIWPLEATLGPIMRRFEIVEFGERMYPCFNSSAQSLL